MGEHGDHHNDLVVDRDFAAALNDVIAAVDDYVGFPDDVTRRELAGAIGVLDDAIATSDARSVSVIGRGALGVTTPVDTFGQLSGAPTVELIPAVQMAAAIELVKAARTEVAGPSDEGLRALSATQDALDELRDDA